MANNVHIQLQKAERMKETIRVFSINLTSNMNELKRKLNDYVNMGFPEDIAETYYERYYLPENKTIENLSTDMLNNHRAFLDRVIEHLNDSLHRQKK